MIRSKHRHDAIVKSFEGKFDDAVEDIIAGMKLGNALSREPYVSSQFSRINVSARVIQTVCDAFKPGDLSSEQINRLIECAGQSTNRQALADSLLCKALMSEEMFEYVRKGDSHVYGGFGDGSQMRNFAKRLVGKLYTSPICKPLDRRHD